MADINVITGNLTVSGVTTLQNTSHIPSGYVSSSFFPTISDLNLVKADTRFWLLNNGTEVPNPSIGYPNANTTGIRIQLNFTDLNRNQLDRHIRTQAFGIFTGNGFNVNNYILTPEGFKQNFTGSFYIPWSLAAGPQGTNPATRLMTINQRLDHIETSGTFALLDNHKIGFGTFQPQEKVHVSGGNLRVDNTGIIENLINTNLNSTNINSINVFSSVISNTGNLYTDKLFITGSTIPTGKNSPGESGQFAFDRNYLYYCRRNNEWVRTALSEW